MENKEIKIDLDLVTRLIKAQFPQWADLCIKPVKISGNDNRTFHLGDRMSIRLPSKECYVPQVEKEQFWLPKLKKMLPQPIPVPLAKGEPGEGYPWAWSICLWLEGQSVNQINVSNMNRFAIDLAVFLKALEKIDSSQGPDAGKHNFYRGGLLKIYDDETRQTIEKLGSQIDAETVMEIWNQALQSKWKRSPVWVHGDVAPSNLLVKDGKLCGVIDFGILGVGDPACDLSIAWTFFTDESREVFKQAMNLDEETWERGRAWALWKALITFQQYADDDCERAREAKFIIDEIILNYKQNKHYP